MLSCIDLAPLRGSSGISEMLRISAPVVNESRKYLVFVEHVVQRMSYLLGSFLLRKPS